MTCPVCEQDVPVTHAVEWDCEPSPGSGQWGMSVCGLCHQGIYCEIPAWDWVQQVLARERKLHEEQRSFMRKLRNLVDKVDRIIP